MITISDFVGAFLHGLTTSRTQSDRTSLKISEHYLNHEYLRGFPVPRMTLKHVELEVNFAVGQISRLETLFKEPEIRKNVANQFHELLVGLPETEPFKSQLGHLAPADSEWRHGISELFETIQRILAGPIADKNTLIHTLSLAIENFFYTMHQAKPGRGLLAGLRNVFTKPTTAAGAPPSAGSIRDWATDRVTAILDASLPGGLAAVSELPDMHILVGGAELEGQKEGSLHKVKLAFVSEDRKWVATEKNGEKKYILDR